MKYMASFIGTFVVFVGYTLAALGSKFCNVGLGIHKIFNTDTGLKLKKYDEQLDQFVKDIEFVVKQREAALENTFKGDRGGNA
jgi:hypothetical protein